MSMCWTRKEKWRKVFVIGQNGARENAGRVGRPVLGKGRGRFYMEKVGRMVADITS